MMVMLMTINESPRRHRRRVTVAVYYTVNRVLLVTHAEFGGRTLGEWLNEASAFFCYNSIFFFFFTLFGPLLYHKDRRAEIMTTSESLRAARFVSPPRAVRLHVLWRNIT